MLSSWQQQSFYYPTDVSIIGSGLTGLITALFLKEKSPKLSVRILERGSYPEGASVKNAGFACFGSVSEILNDIESEGEEMAIERVRKRHRGLQLLQKVVGNADIGYTTDGGFEVFTESEEGIYRKSLDAIAKLNSLLSSELGFDPYSQVKNDFGFNCLPQLIKIHGEASMDSGKLLKLLMKKAHDAGVEMSFGCEVEEFISTGSGWNIKTNRTELKTKKLVVATNGFTQKLLPQMPVLPCRGQVLVTSPVPELKVKGTFHVNEGYYYFRPFDGGIMLGGGRHLDRHNEITEVQETTPKIQDALENLLKTLILPGKEFSIKKRWSGILGYGPNNEKEAIVKELQPDLFIGARLGGMGIAMAPLVAREITGMVLQA